MGAVVLALVSCGSPAETEVLEAEEYAPGLFADVYLPAGGDDRPFVVLVHGGGFSFGERQQLTEFARALADDGVVAATIDYRLTSGRWFPTDSLDDPALGAAADLATEDTRTAIAWMQAQADRFDLDPSRGGVSGYSAGAITAIETAVTDPTVVGAVSIAGAGIHLDRLDGGDPPLLLLHGTDDETIPVGLADATCAQAVAVGAPCEVRRFPGVRHDLVGIPMDLMTDAIADMVRAAPERGGS